MKLLVTNAFCDYSLLILVITPNLQWFYSKNAEKMPGVRQYRFSNFARLLNATNFVLKNSEERFC